MTGQVSGNINTNYIPSSFLNADGTVKADKQEIAATISAGVQARVEHMPEAEKQAFLSMIQGGLLDLTPSADGTPVDIETSLNNLEAAAEKLGGLMEQIETLAGSAGDAVSLLARVMVEQAASQRKNALEDRLNARETARSELMNQASEMKDSAEKMQNGAIAALVLTVVSAVVSIGMSIASLKGTIGAGKDLKAMRTGLNEGEVDLPKLPSEGGGVPKTNPSEMSLEMKRIDINVQKSQQIGTVGQTTNQFGQGLSNYASTQSQALSKQADAAGSEDAAKAQEAEALADTKKEIQQGLDELIKSIINFLKEMADAKAEMARSFTKV